MTRGLCLWNRGDPGEVLSSNGRFVEFTQDEMEQSIPRRFE